MVGGRERDGESGGRDPIPCFVRENMGGGGEVEGCCLPPNPLKWILSLVEGFN